MTNRSQALTLLRQALANPHADFREGQWEAIDALVNRQQNSYLASDAVDDDPMNPLLEHALTYRITVGPQVGRKVFILQMLPAATRRINSVMPWARWPFSAFIDRGDSGYTPYTSE